jgi:hypothetical protein
MPHVELIQNEWAAGQQRVVAKLVLNGSQHVEVSAVSEIWEPIALKPFIDPDTGREVSPQDEPERFVLALHRHLNGDYLFATQAHDDGDCEYEVGSVLPIAGDLRAAHEAVH